MLRTPLLARPTTRTPPSGPRWKESTCVTGWSLYWPADAGPVLPAGRRRRCRRRCLGTRPRLRQPLPAPPPSPQGQPAAAGGHEELDEELDDAGIPTGWRECPAMGRPIDRFIPMKAGGGAAWAWGGKGGVAGETEGVPPLPRQPADRYWRTLQFWILGQPEALRGRCLPVCLPAHSPPTSLPASCFARCLWAHASTPSLNPGTASQSTTQWQQRRRCVQRGGITRLQAPGRAHRPSTLCAVSPVCRPCMAEPSKRPWPSAASPLRSARVVPACLQAVHGITYEAYVPLQENDEPDPAAPPGKLFLVRPCRGGDAPLHRASPPVLTNALQTSAAGWKARGDPQHAPPSRCLAPDGECCRVQAVQAVQSLWPPVLLYSWQLLTTKSPLPVRRHEAGARAGGGGHGD